MAWEGSNRRARLPSNWSTIRERILRRDGRQCTYHRSDTGKRCSADATDVDHIKRGDDHRDENLRSLCSWHHRQKSAREGSEAAAKNRARIASKLVRVEAHPGLLG